MAKHAVVRYTHETDQAATFGHIVLKTRNPYYSRRFNTYGAPDVFDRTFSKVGAKHGKYTRLTAELIGHWETSRTGKRFVVSPRLDRNVTTFKA